MAKQIKRGDEIIVISGSHKGERGKILEVQRDKNRVLIEGVNLVKKHQRKTKLKLRINLKRQKQRKQKRQLKTLLSRSRVSKSQQPKLRKRRLRNLLKRSQFRMLQRVIMIHLR